MCVCVCVRVSGLMYKCRYKLIHKRLYVRL